MFFDIGPLELVALVVLAIFVFGPEKLPKLIQDTSRFIRKVREFSDSARDDIRTELGPEFKDFEFQDLNPKTFARKHLLENDELGIKEIRNGFDLRKDLAEVTDAVNGREDVPGTAPVNGTAAGASEPAGGSTGKVRMEKDAAAAKDLPVAPPYDADAT
ncbi:sec-independent translocase [Streptomyces sp. TR06-5]|uniref:sec-independent translocase n=1 Tax=unclassified Streptomyces TaxID=2593676 RepID=UPI0039A09271